MKSTEVAFCTRCLQSVILDTSEECRRVAQILTELPLRKLRKLIRVFSLFKLV